MFMLQKLSKQGFLSRSTFPRRQMREKINCEVERNCELNINMNTAFAYLFSSAAIYLQTRFGPNRPAADMEGNGEFNFWVTSLRIFGDILEDFWQILEKFVCC